MHILLTNDDGVTSRGLFQAKLALERHGSVSVIAPDSNRSGSARSITIDRALNVTEVELRDGSTGFATDGTPVDCVRFGELGLVGDRPDLIVSGINYGYNLGDDVTYSGTVAAAFEGLLLGIPGIAVSQGAPTASGSDFRRHETYDFGPAADFLARLVGRVIEHGIPEGTLLNVNVPSTPDGVAVGRLGKRIYRDRLELEADDEGRRRYRIYGGDPSYHDEPGTDFRAIAEGRISVTPIHLDLTSVPGIEALREWEF
ncbi:MAG: 5/3-nucleotidase [Gaiellales bacterium]|nr:5/3-nucleotidase [Gaiellales bacterium]